MFDVTKLIWLDSYTYNIEIYQDIPYTTEYISKKYYVGAEFKNKKNQEIFIVGKAFPQKNQQYTSKYVVQFKDCGLKKAISSDHLNKGSFGYPITFASGNNDNNQFKTLYKRFEQINLRCNNKSNKDYERYGARGIRNEFEDFHTFWLCLMEDENIYALLNHPEEYELDRINNEGNYSPSNIRITTRSENQRNKRNNTVYNLIDNNTGYILYTGIKTDCEDYIKEHLGVATSLDSTNYKKEIGKSNGFSVSYVINQ